MLFRYLSWWRRKKRYYIRLKDIPHQVIINKCKRIDITIEEFYEPLYTGAQMHSEKLKPFLYLGFADYKSHKTLISLFAM